MFQDSNVAFESLNTLNPKSGRKMRLANTADPINCIPVSPGTNKLATTPATPATPKAILTHPNRLPKVPAPNMATPRAMKPTIKKRLPTKKNV